MESGESSSQLTAEEGHESASQRGTLLLTSNLSQTGNPYGSILEVQIPEKYNLRSWLTNTGESVSGNRIQPWEDVIQHRLT